MSEQALDILYGLVLEDGHMWGELACEQQKDDAYAFLVAAEDGGPRRHFDTRPRGGSKTTDMAGVALAWLAADAPLRARGYVVASNGDQAAILIDAAASLVARTPELDGVLTVENERIVAPNGAWVRILNCSDSGAWGLRDAHLLILDEFAQWPETRGAKRVYTAIRSTVQKVKGCRMAILTSAGEPAHWSHAIFELAAADKTWRVSEMPGPVTWQDPEEIEALRRELTPSEYDRLVLNIWSEDEDRAVSPEDFALAARPVQFTYRAPRGLSGGGWRIHGPSKRHKYTITVDIGTKNDATVIVISHAEPLEPDDRRGPKKLIVDHLEVWRGSRKRPVQLRDVEAWLVLAGREWNRPAIYGDPDQFVGTLQNLSRMGLRAQEFIFSATSVGQVATAMVQAFRNQQIEVPDVPSLKEELLRVRLRESAPGVTRLDHDKNAHDDQAVAIGMACHLLLGRLWGSTAAFQEMMRAKVEKRREKSEEQSTYDRVVDQVRQRRHMPQRQRAAHQRRCQHRWRSQDNTCAFGCGATKEHA